ncbi:unnamed protein product, partial [Amoebophrya sp. A25]
GTSSFEVEEDSGTDEESVEKTVAQEVSTRLRPPSYQDKEAQHHTRGSHQEEQKQQKELLVQRDHRPCGFHQDLHPGLRGSSSFPRNNTSK